MPGGYPELDPHVPTVKRNNNIFGKSDDNYYEIGNVDDPLLWDESDQIDQIEPSGDNLSETA
jgi:hypothetical protein